MTAAGFTLIGVGVLLVIVGIGAGRISGKALAFSIEDWSIDYKELHPLVRAVPILLGIALVAIGGLLVFKGTQSQTPDSKSFAIVSPSDAPGQIVAYGGPSTQTSYQRLTVLAAGSYVHLICTAYGEPVVFGSTAHPLWDYTDKGWVNDHFVQTNVSGPAANGCTGTVGAPMEGKTTPSLSSGPFAVVADEGTFVSVHSDASPASSQLTQLEGGDLVVLVCSRSTGPVVMPPKGYSLSNNDWDQIAPHPDWDAGTKYWVPDSFVASYSARSTAPACG
jgi:hypothetical protein